MTDVIKQWEDYNKWCERNSLKPQYADNLNKYVDTVLKCKRYKYVEWCPYCEKEYWFHMHEEISKGTAIQTCDCGNNILICSECNTKGCRDCTLESHNFSIREVENV